MCCCILLLNYVGSYAQTKNSTKRQTLWNPVLLIEYDPSKVKYEQFPLNSNAMCAKYLADESNMIYAHIILGNSKYLANMGIWHSNVEEYDSGELILVYGDKCQSFDLEWTLMALPPKDGYQATESKETFPGRDSPQECVQGQCHPVFRSANEELLLRNFVKDAIQRAIKAYGSDALFRAQACKPEEEKELSDSGYVIVLQELRTYCSNVPQ